MLIHAVHGNVNNSNASHARGTSALQIQGVTAVHRSICLTWKAVKLQPSKMHSVSTQKLKRGTITLLLVVYKAFGKCTSIQTAKTSLHILSLAVLVN